MLLNLDSSVKSGPNRLVLAGISSLLILIVSIPWSVAQEWTRVERPSELEFPAQEFHPPKPERRELPNGMVVYMLPDSSIPQVRAYARIKAGSIHEKPEEVGLASLTASLLRLGGSESVSADEMNDQLEFVGASLESGSTRDYASVSLRVLSKDKEMGFEYFADILRHPAFPQDKIDQRKGEVSEKLRRQLDDPMEITRNEFREMLYGDHPYGRNPDGTQESLASFTREDLVRWHEETYHPNRIILAISGDFEPDWLMETLEKLFGDWPKFEGEIPEPQVGDQVSVGETFFIEKDLNQSTVRFGHLGIRKDNPDAIPLDVLNFVIGGGGFSSRLVNEVRTRGGYAYMVASIFDEPLLQGQFVTILQTQSKNTMEATELAKEVISKAIQPGSLTDEEIELAKESKLNDFVFNFETPQAVVQAYADLEFYGLPDNYLETYRENLAKVTREDLEKVGTKYIHPDKMSLLVLGNSEVKPLLEEAEGNVQTLTLQEVDSE
ncbi:MAG: insulinase family protein [Candidatus Omnitrophica bacterium]|nr:insulinase family protein [Candidatus Omnitrophota bacterium]MCA9429773.1 insulinase family protein [Candidatus Omnitrophota bacterium]